MPEAVPSTQLDTLVTVPSLTPTPLPQLTLQSTTTETVPPLTPAAVKPLQQDPNVQEQLSSEAPIDNEFVRSRVTPQKMSGTNVLLPYFFSCMELSNSNTL